MKKFLKRIREIVFINYIMRNFIKLLIKLGVNIDITHFVVSGIVSTKLPDNEIVKMYTKGDDFIPSQVYWKGYAGYEYSVIPFYYLSNKSNVIVDIGANVGYFSLVASASNSNAKIYAFEPVKRIIDRFRKQVLINNFNNIKIEELIVGDLNGEVSFYVPKGNLMSLASSTKKGWVSDVEEVIVNSTTLDNYKNSNEISKIDLIKMDCEFHELEVLKGMSEILKNDKPLIIMEILFPEAKGVKDYFENNQHIEIEKILVENGYYFYQITSASLKRVKVLKHNEIDRNYVFSTKKSSVIEIPYNRINEELI